MLVAGACTSPTGDVSSSGSSSGGPIDPEARSDTLPGGPPGSEALAELPGRLAITATGELVLTDPTGGSAEVIDSAAFVAQPTWAPTGEALAWTRADGGHAEVRIASVEMIAAEPEDRLEFVESIDLDDRPAIYLQWNTDSTRLGFLQAEDPQTADTPGIQLSTVVVADGKVSNLVSAASVYFSWALDGSGVAVHQGSDVVVVPRLADAPPLARSEGWFTAPAWLTPDTLLVATAGSLDRLDTATGEATSLLTLEGATEFVVNRTRSHVAFLQPGAGYLTVQAPGPDTAPDEQRALQVLDIATGDLALVGPRAGEAAIPIAFEWSPDGSILAFFAPSTHRPDLLRWYFWQLGPGGGHIVGASTAFTPSAVSVQQYLPFFAQYAQSATGWAPNSSAFAFAGSIEAVSGIFVHVLGATPQSVYVGPGDYVTWSPANVQGAGRSFL